MNSIQVSYEIYLVTLSKLINNPYTYNRNPLEREHAALKDFQGARLAIRRIFHLFGPQH